MRSINAVSVVAALALVIAGCTSSPATGAGSPGGSDGGANSGGSGGAASAGMASQAVPVGRSCSVQVSGDVAKSWKTTQSAGTLMVSYWLNSADRKTMALTGETFLLNCDSDAGTVNFDMTNGTTAADFPEAPGTYVIDMNGLGGTQAGHVGMLINLKSGGDWRLTEPGTFKITTLGGSRFAGSFSVKIGQLGATGKYDGGSATITGSFDLACTGSACS